MCLWIYIYMYILPVWVEVDVAVEEMYWWDWIRETCGHHILRFNTPSTLSLAQNALHLIPINEIPRVYVHQHIAGHSQKKGRKKCHFESNQLMIIDKLSLRQMASFLMLSFRVKQMESVWILCNSRHRSREKPGMIRMGYGCHLINPMKRTNLTCLKGSAVWYLYLW